MINTARASTVARGVADLPQVLDRFLQGLKLHLHHEGVDFSCPKVRAMRFENPIVAIKQVPASVQDDNGLTKAKSSRYPTNVNSGRNEEQRDIEEFQ